VCKVGLPNALAPAPNKSDLLPPATVPIKAAGLSCDTCGISELRPLHSQLHLLVWLNASTALPQTPPASASTGLLGWW
jgi:hypothetical protein